MNTSWHLRCAAFVSWSSQPGAMGSVSRAMACHRFCCFAHPSSYGHICRKPLAQLASFRKFPVRKWSSDGCGRPVRGIPSFVPHWHHSNAFDRGHGAAVARLSSTEVSVLVTKAEFLKSNVVEVLEERGLIESVTSEALREACGKDTLKVYCGFDPTAESLHLGNLLGIIVLSWFQRCGHIPVALLGGATARVGDPSGKSAERPVLDDETIARNLDGIQRILAKILQVESTEDRTGDSAEVEDKNASASRRHGPVVLNNFDWWKQFSLLDFLRDVGKYARVGTMMAKESVKTRLNSEEGMSYTEFTYQLLQGYDFVHLFKEEGVSVQIGGSDQWGNITAGTDLIRRLLQQDGAYGLTFPLLLKSDGSKFGKSEGGAIWLSPSALSPYKFYQYLFATPDADVIRFMKILTFVDIEEIKVLESRMGQPGYVPNSVQKRLAEEVTIFVHGQSGLAEALKATQALAPGATTRLDWQALDAIAQDVPSCLVPQASVVGSPLVDFCVSTGLLQSKAAVRRLIKQGGLYLNNEKVEDEGKAMVAEDIVDGKMLLLSAGKKNKLVVRTT